jgi:hypothetical protein
LREMERSIDRSLPFRAFVSKTNFVVIDSAHFSLGQRYSIKRV